MTTQKRKDGFELREYEQGVFSLVAKDAPMDPDKNIVLLNSAGAYLWGLLYDPISKETIINTCAERFDVDLDIMENDVTDFLNLLMEKDLLDIIEEE